MHEDTLFEIDEAISKDVPGQWRLTRIQLYNWGTIDGLYDIEVPRKGLLLTGESGSGKSTILDAITSIMAPDNTATFNAAAAAGTGGDTARNRVTYVRGAYGRTINPETHESVTTYLREGATSSGIALTFRDGKGKVWTAVRVFYIAAHRMTAADLKTLFFGDYQDIDLKPVMELIKDSAFTTALKQAYPDAKFATKSSQFQSRLQLAVGIGSPTASALLHKTIATKNLSNLNRLMREYMLDEPETGQLAENAVEQFQDLRLAHANVVDAEEQINTLTPIRQRMQRREDAKKAEKESERLLGLLDLFGSSLQVDFAKRGIVQKSKDKNDAEQQQRDLEKRISESESHVKTLESRRNQLGGVRVAELEGSEQLVQHKLQSCQDRRDQMKATFELLDSPVPTTSAEFSKVKSRAEQELDAIAKTEEQTNTDFSKAAAKVEQLNTLKDRLETELKSLYTRRSAIPSDLVFIREEMARGLNADSSTFPYVGELIDVTDAKWRPAIERLLHSYAQTMLVPGEYADRVAKWVNGRRLTNQDDEGMRLVYERVPARVEPPQKRIHPHSTVSKLRIKECRFKPYLSKELAKRFDYECVESVHELSAHDWAITKEGLIRRKARHDKDDRHAIDDQSRWILGTSNNERVEALLARYNAIEHQISKATQARDIHKNHFEDLIESKGKLSELVQTNWDSLDTSRYKAELKQIRRDLEELTNPESDLGMLTGRIKETNSAITDLKEQHSSVLRRVGELGGEIKGFERTIAQHHKIYGDAEITEEDQQTLQQKCAPERRTISAEHLNESLTNGRRTLEDERRRADRRRSDAEKIIQGDQSTYIAKWPQHSTNLVPGIDGVDDFIRRLAELENDNLPKFRQKFRELLEQQTRQSITQLSSQLHGSIQEVRNRIEPVNQSLAQTPYDRSRGHYLTIIVRDARSVRALEFQEELKAITGGHLSMESDTDKEAYQRFVKVESVMKRLSSEEHEWKLWRQEVLDTRRHVSFRAIVENSDGEQVDNYEGSQGRSGGQSQKLVTFCLAAALRYQLADEGNPIPRFGTIVLDEAFDKTDAQFTRDSLDVFKAFGFQLIMATPMKMIQTFEPYIGGVVEVMLRPNNTTAIASMTYEEAVQQADSKPADQVAVAR